MIAKSLLLAAMAVTVMSVTQEEYARYISQQQLQKQAEKGQLARRPVLLQVVPSDGATAYPQPSPAARPASYQQPAYQPQAAAYQPQPAAYQPRPAAYQPQQYAPQPPSYQPALQSYQQPEEYQEPEQPYQPPARAQAPRPKAAPKPKPYNADSKPEEEEDNNPNAQYQFSFDISDDESTNYHNRKEQRDGEKISGSYSVVDADGFIRTVTYTADPQEGFKAEVSREPTNIQVKIPTPAPQVPSPAPHYKLPERKAQPQYIAVQASEPEVAEQPAEPISGYYRSEPQQVKAQPAHRFAAPRPQQAGSKASALGYATAPTNAPILYQAYQQ